MKANTAAKAESVTLPAPSADKQSLVSGATQSMLTIREPVVILVQSMAVSAAVWAFMLYFGLLMFAFLWSLSEARDLYAQIMDGKAINWIITAAVIMGGAIYFLRMQTLRELRRPTPEYHPPPRPAPPPRRKTGGVYGRANAAFDHEIDAALRGKTGGFDPMFEE